MRPGHAAVRSVRLAAGLAWAAAPLICLISVLLVTISGVTPAVTAWLQRAILDELAAAGLVVTAQQPGCRGRAPATSLPWP